MPSKTCPNCDAPIAGHPTERLVTCSYCNQRVENPFYEPPAPQPPPQPQPQVHVAQVQSRRAAKIVKIVVPLVIAFVLTIFVAVFVVFGLLVGAATDAVDTSGGLDLPPDGVLGDYARTQKQVYAPGEVVLVDFYDITSGSNDWIAIAEQGQPKNQYVTYEYTNGKTAGQLRFDDALAEGAYEVRVFFGSGYDLAGVYPFRVDAAVAPEYLRVFKTAYTPGEPILVEYTNLPPNNSAWIAVSEAGSGDNSYVTYEYTNKQSGGRLEIKYDLKPGQYEVRLYLDSGYTVAKRIPITVEKGRPKGR